MARTRSGSRPGRDRAHQGLRGPDADDRRRPPLLRAGAGARSSACSGPNGAGKTTTIQMLLSTLKPTSGRIEYFGQSLETAREAILARVGFASAYSKLPSHLTIDENLDVFGRLYGLSAGRSQGPIPGAARRGSGSGTCAKRIMAGLSAGQTTRVMLAKAFLARPRVALLDEPTASLDPDIAHEVREFVCEQRDQDGRLDPLHLAQHGRGRPDLRPGALPRRGQDRRRWAGPTSWRPRRPRPGSASASSAGSMTCSATRPSAGWPPGRGRHGRRRDRRARHRRASSRRSPSSDVRYTEIALEKPTLEDYFLKLARAGRRGAGAARMAATQGRAPHGG